MVNMMKYFGERDHAHNYMVTSEKEQESKENFVYPFQNDPYFASMEYVVPLQVIARKLSLDLGIDCNISSEMCIRDRISNCGSQEQQNFWNIIRKLWSRQRNGIWQIRKSFLT